MHQTKELLRFAVITIIAVLASVGLANAATNIGANISTGGNLTVIGNVGIGTTTPAANLHVFSTNNTSLRLEGNSPQLILSDNEATAGNRNWGFQFFDEGLEGVVSSDDLSSGAGWLYVKRTNNTIDSVNFPLGNVGIGTTTPDSKLVVDGTLKLTGDLYLNSSNPIMFGPTGSFRMWDTGSNSIITTNSDTNRDLYIFTGTDKTTFFDGRVSIGTLNVPVYMLDVNGDVNIAENNKYKIGGLNILFGSSTLANTYSGFYTGGLTTTGSNNSFFGFYSGMINSSGYDNTFIGTQSGAQNTSGFNNTFLGFNSGGLNTIGTSNVFLGNATGYLNVDGSRNVFLGELSGYSNSSGADNIFLGYKSGYNETGSNKLYITNSQTTATSSLVYGEFDNNILSFNANVGIGTTSPQATLDINGYMRLEKNASEPVACSGTNDGAIALASTYMLCVCNGSSWVHSVGTSTDSCVW